LILEINFIGVTTPPLLKGRWPQAGGVHTPSQGEVSCLRQGGGVHTPSQGDVSCLRQGGGV